MSTIQYLAPAELTDDMTILRDGQSWAIIEITKGAGAGEGFDVQVECVDGNVGHQTCWTFYDEDSVRVQR